jgi:hypothetical protein
MPAAFTEVDPEDDAEQDEPAPLRSRNDGEETKFDSEDRRDKNDESEIMPPIDLPKLKDDQPGSIVDLPEDEMQEFSESDMQD